MDNDFKPTSVGSQADISSEVDISKVHRGVFSDVKNIRAFIDIGIAPIERELPSKIFYVDFGGGQGLLARPVTDFLVSNGHEVVTIVADANQQYLKVSSEVGLNTKLCNLEQCEFNDVDLGTMRAVLHYNGASIQAMIMKNVYKTLKQGGYFVHQVSSGGEVNCSLRSAIANMPSLGRVGAGNYHWTSLDETVKLHKDAGFSQTQVVGEAPGAAWGPDEQWERFNAKITNQAIQEGDETILAKIFRRKKEFLDATKQLIESYLKKYGPEETGIEKLPDEKYKINYKYPIIVSRK